MAKSWRRRSPFTKSKFKPITQAVGEFALAWNDFHEALGKLFVTAVAGEHPEKDDWFQAFGVWAALQTTDRNTLC